MDHARKTPNSKHLDLKKGMTKLTILFYYTISDDLL